MTPEEPKSSDPETEVAPCFQNCGHLVTDGPCSKCGWQKTPDVSVLIQHLIDEADPSRPWWDYGCWLCSSSTSWWDSVTNDPPICCPTCGNVRENHQEPCRYCGEVDL